MVKNTDALFSDVVDQLFPLGYDKVISKGIENAWKKAEAKGLANAN